VAAKILIIDDENLFREDLGTLLRQKGHTCKTAPDGEKAIKVLEDFSPDVILCDIVMPGRSGIQLLDEWARICPECFVIIITAYASIETAVEALRRGASDYILKPLILEDVLHKIDRLMEHKRLTHEINSLRRQLSGMVDTTPLIGQSDSMLQVKKLIKSVAATNSTVLITGASGTGKEVVARMIHASSTAAQEPFVAINCASIPEHLLESELFGHVKGAFTGADSDREGFFELAGKGTILLDEISEMPLALQSKLLRIMEERKFIRVGGRTTSDVEARMIISTN
jgi:DNA-binding NtrC family response regulator